MLLFTVTLFISAPSSNKSRAERYQIYDDGLLCIPLTTHVDRDHMVVIMCVKGKVKIR
jgi:hypothetical protein